MVDYLKKARIVLGAATISAAVAVVALECMDISVDPLLESPGKSSSSEQKIASNDLRVLAAPPRANPDGTRDDEDFNAAKEALTGGLCHTAHSKMLLIKDRDLKQDLTSELKIKCPQLRL